MSTLTSAQLLEQLNWRYAVKKFDASKKISASDWKTLEQVLTLTPSSYGLQPWKFVSVQNPAIRQQLTPLSWGQTQVQDCSHLVVFTHLRKVTEEYVHKFVASTAKTRGVPAESMKGYADMMIGDVVKGPRSKTADTWTAKQCYIGMGNLMTSAAILGIDTCPMEGIDPAGYDKVLGLEATEYQTVMVVACGYRHAEDGYQKMKKARFDVSELIKTI